jgi:hypothetical protein
MIIAFALKPWPRGVRFLGKHCPPYHLPRLIDLGPCRPTSVTEEFGEDARACLRHSSSMPLTNVGSGSGTRSSIGQLAKPWFRAKLRSSRCSVRWRTASRDRHLVHSASGEESWRIFSMTIPLHNYRSFFDIDVQCGSGRKMWRKPLNELYSIFIR